MSIINEALKKAEQEKNKIVTDEPGYTNIASKIYKPKPDQDKKPETFKEEPAKPLLLLEPLPPVAKKHNYLMWFLLAILISAAAMSISIIVTKPNEKNIKHIAKIAPSILEPEKIQENLTISSPQPTPPPQPPLSTVSPSSLTTQAMGTITPIAPESEPAKFPVSPPSLILSGIVAGGNDSFAIIDGRIVKKGDIISGAKVREIYSDRVVLEFDGIEFSLRSP